MEDKRKVLELFEKNKKQLEEKVNSEIEKNRKGWAKIKLTDENGAPVKNAKIRLKQKSHEFKYGANLFMLDELETKEKNELYKKYFKECFNMATLPFYWSDLEPEEGKPRYDKNSPKVYRRPPIDLCMEFCEENGIEPREHALAYDRFFPQWLWDKEVYDVKKAFVKRCKEISERYADRIPTIEVTNEIFWDNGRTCLYDEPDFEEWCFKTARRYFPANTLGINEAAWIWDSHSRCNDTYYLLAENLLMKGVSIDALGMQYHMFMRKEDYYEQTRNFYNPLHLYKTLDTYAKLGKEMQITEVTIPCYSESAEDEALQAEIIEYLYSIWFSYKNVSQIVYWNLVDGYAAFAPQGDMTAGENYYYGGLIRFDFTPKPAYYKIKELFEKKWHTEAVCQTDNEGLFEFNGFYGKYDIEIEIDAKTVSKEINFHTKGKRSFEIKLS